MGRELGNNTDLGNLVAQIKKSDQNAFNVLFDCMWEPLFTYAASIIMNTGVAKDLVQDVWVDFWQRKEDLEIQNIKAYLYKAIRYRCYNHLRDIKFNKTQIEMANTIGVSSEVEKQQDVIDLSERINDAISRLPQKSQEIFRLSRLNDISNKEIAKRFNISQRTVENQISFALRKIRKDLSVLRAVFFI
ncbi:MAG: RNA polymerase sigma-70 factor [Bacteroidota bacterium]